MDVFDRYRAAMNEKLLGSNHLRVYQLLNDHSA